MRPRCPSIENEVFDILNFQHKIVLAIPLEPEPGAQVLRILQFNWRALCSL